jgi:hypothetical protein
MLAGLGPNGWRVDVTEPRPESSFYAATLGRALGGDEPPAALRSTTTRWMAEIATAPGGHVDWRRTYFTLRLAAMLGLPVPEPVRRRLSRRASAEVTAGADVGWLLAAAGVAAVALPADAVDALAVRLTTSLPATMDAALAAYAAGRAARVEAVVMRARDAVRALALNGAFRYSPGAPAPDLVSTVGAADILGLNGADRRRALQIFSTAAGATLEPANGTGRGTVDLRTMYLGYLLLGRVDAVPAFH